MSPHSTTPSHAPCPGSKPRPGSKSRPGSRARRIGIVALLIAVLSAAHFLASPHDAALHAFLFKATFLPLVLAGLLLGLRGALAACAVTGAIYLVHVLVQLVPAGCHDAPSIASDLVLLVLMSLVTGLLSDRRAQALERERERTAELEEAGRSLRAAEERLRRSDRLRALGELAAGLAHEIRNPLGGIRGAGEILARPSSSAAVREEFAEVLRGEVTRLDRVVESFLGFARPPAGRPGSVELGELARSVFLLVRGEADLAGVGIELEAGRAVRAWADGDLLRQVLLNVLLNAVQATPSGGTVRLRVLETLDPALEIEDTGPGIPPGLAERVFDPFVTGRPEGTGLGLALAHRLMESMGGSIEIARTGSTGTLMRLRLPAAPEQGLDLEASASAGASGGRP